MFWREKPLDEQELKLLGLIQEAHHRSVYRQNPSTAAVLNSMQGSGDAAKAFASGILTLGGKHAPLEQTHRFLSLEDPAREVHILLKAEMKVPGWGGTFQKDAPDPIWKPVHAFLDAHWPFLARKLDDVTAELHNFARAIHPNPSAYTAATAIVIGLPAKLAVWLFVRSRLDGWAHIAYENGGKL